MLREALKKKPFLILDGGLATELEARGCSLNTRLWSAEILHSAPQHISDVHRSYLSAGADIITTSGYQASSNAFSEAGYTDTQAMKLMELSVQLALEACQSSKSPCWTAVSCGPYGAFLADGSEYRGDYHLNFETLHRFHAERLENYLSFSAHGHIYAFETIPDLLELKAVLKVITDFKAPAWVSVSARNERQMSDGSPIEDASVLAQACSSLQAFGINCSAPKYLESLLRRVRKNYSGPMIAYPNRGDIYNAQKKTWSGGEEQTDFTEATRQWYQAGARIIGGCCLTGPEEIRRIAAYRQQMEPAS